MKGENKGTQQQERKIAQLNMSMVENLGELIDSAHADENAILNSLLEGDSVLAGASVEAAD